MKYEQRVWFGHGDDTHKNAPPFFTPRLMQNWNYARKCTSIWMASAKTHRNFYDTICTETHQHFKKKTPVKKRSPRGDPFWVMCCHHIFGHVFPSRLYRTWYAPKRTWICTKTHLRCVLSVWWCVCVCMCVWCVWLCVYLCVCVCVRWLNAMIRELAETWKFNLWVV